MNSCSYLIRDIEKSETYYELSMSLNRNGEYIAESLGVDLHEECDECDRKKTEIINLEHKLYNKSFTPSTIDDEYKLEAFLRYKDNFSVSDFESLLG
jgi:hypothetical protein